MYTVLTLQIAEQKMYEHWKQNAPELREVWINKHKKNRKFINILNKLQKYTSH